MFLSQGQGRSFTEFFQRAVLPGAQPTSWSKQICLLVRNGTSPAELMWLPQKAPALSCTPAEGGTRWVPTVSPHRDGTF